MIRQVLAPMVPRSAMVALPRGSACVSSMGVTSPMRVAPISAPAMRHFAVAPLEKIPIEVPVLSGLSKTYATALYEVSKKKNMLDDVSAHLRSLRNVIKRNSSLAAFLSSRHTTDVSKLDQLQLAADSVVVKSGYASKVEELKQNTNDKQLQVPKVGDKAPNPLHPLVRLFLTGVAERQRLDEVPSIIDDFFALSQYKSKVRTATVTTGRELSAEQKKKVEARLGQAMGKDEKLQIKYKTSPSVGGLIVDVGFMRFDGSLSSQLDSTEAFLRKRGRELLQPQLPPSAEELAIEKWIKENKPQMRVD